MLPVFALNTPPHNPLTALAAESVSRRAADPVLLKAGVDVKNAGMIKNQIQGQKHAAGHCRRRLPGIGHLTSLRPIAAAGSRRPPKRTR